MKVYNIEDLPHRQLISSKSGEIFSQSAVLTDLLACQKFFVHHEILLPGKKASSPHRHTFQEEIFLVLDGFPTVHLGDHSQQLKPGDFIGFNPGSYELHFIENTTDEEVRLLVICSNQENDQIIFE